MNITSLFSGNVHKAAFPSLAVCTHGLRSRWLDFI